MTNSFYDPTSLPPKSINEPHMPIELLLDVSGSMDGEAIKQLNKSVNRFPKDVCQDERAADVVDICIVAFNDTQTTVQGWRPISEVSPIELTAGGGTNLSEALNYGISMLRQKTEEYKKMGITDIKIPYMILITDGYGGDVSEVARLIKSRTREEKMKLWVLAVKGYDKATVAELTDGIRVFELINEDGYDFSEFFSEIMAETIKRVSTSSPDQKIHIPNPLENKNSTLKVPDLDAWI